MKWNLFIFPLKSTPHTDHCTNCGGEEYEGSTGELHNYLHVFRDENQAHYTYQEMSLCNDCFGGFELQMKMSIDA